MDLLKKYNPWEIVVALLPPLFAIDEIWHYCTDDYPSALYQIVKHVFAFGYIAILLYSVYCMYRGAKWSGRFPKLMLTLLITLTAAELLAFANRFLPQGPTEYYVLTGLSIAYTVVTLFVIVRMFMARLNVLAIAFTCVAVALPLLSTLIFSLLSAFSGNMMWDGLYTTVDIVAHATSFLGSLCYSVIFLYRNDFYKPLDE